MGVEGRCGKESLGNCFPYRGPLDEEERKYGRMGYNVAER
jgi:hypothetical protein